MKEGQPGFFRRNSRDIVGLGALAAAAGIALSQGEYLTQETNESPSNDSAVFHIDFSPTPIFGGEFECETKYLQDYWLLPKKDVDKCLGNIDEYSYEVTMGPVELYLRGVFNYKRYKEDGIGFRDAVKYVSQFSGLYSNSHEASIIEQMYYFFKYASGGVEYIRNGEVFDPKEGEKYRLSIPSEEGLLPIIKSLGSPFEIDYENFVCDGSIIEIGSHKVFFEPREDKAEFRSIYQNIEVISNDCDFKPAPIGMTGFMQPLWFGEKID